MSEPEEQKRTDGANPAAATPLRLLSLLAIGIVFVLYRPGAEPTLLNTLVLPVLAGLAAWYLTHSLAVLAIGVFFLAFAHADPSSSEFLEGLVYPALTTLSAGVIVWIMQKRFRLAMAARRTERRAEQARARDESQDA